MDRTYGLVGASMSRLADLKEKTERVNHREEETSSLPAKKQYKRTILRLILARDNLKDYNSDDDDDDYIYGGE